jgi:hypothetical protein
MDPSEFEHVGQHNMNETLNQSNLAAFGFADALRDGVSAAERAARDCAEDATELFFQTKKRLQRRPKDSFLVTLAAGIAAGTVIGWMLKTEISQQQNVA